MSKMRNLCREERRELKVLADDFGLLERKDIQNIIDSCVTYDEGQRKILSIYNQVYMQLQRQKEYVNCINEWKILYCT